MIARSDQGSCPIRPDELTAAELLEGVRERFARRTPSATRRSRCDANGLRLEADPLRVQQALGNLVDNALRYGGGTSSSPPSRATAPSACTCATTAPGSRPSSPPSSASPAPTAPAARGGSGLGLAIVAAIARAHGGEAGAADRPGGGADVWIELPCAS